MQRTILTLIFSLLGATVALAQPTINNHTILTTNIEQYNKLELGVELGNVPPGTNPYDWDQIHIEVIFTHTNTAQQYTAHGFSYDDFTINAGTPCNPQGTFATNEFLTPQPTNFDWRVRFAPPLTGSWTYVINLYSNNMLVASTNSEPFNVNTSNNHGYIGRQNPNPWYGLRFGNYYFTDGSTYFPTGTNLHYYNQPYCWETWNDSYLGTMNKLQDVGGNFARLLMIGDEWGHQNGPNGPYVNGFIFNIEWGSSLDANGLPVANLGNYDEKQNIAFLLDKLIEDAEQKGIYFQLGLTGYRELEAGYTYDWTFNPFRNPPLSLTNPNQFLTNSQAHEYYKRKLRYIISRWGYSTNIFAWELMTEAGGTVSKPDLVNWLNLMSNEIKNIDDFKHLVSISGGGEYFDFTTNSFQHQIFSIPSVDVIDHHTYGSSELYNFAHYRRENMILKSKDNFYKPLMAGEFGKDETNKGELYIREHDNKPVNFHKEFHNTIWSTSFSGQSGTSSMWYPYIYAPWSPVYNHIKPLRVLINELNFESDFFEPISSDCAEPDIAHIGMSQSAYNHFMSPPNNPSPNNGYGDNFGKCNYPIYGQDIEVTSDPNTSFSTPGSLSSKVLVFGLKGQESILGWIHKKDNIWWKLPHLGWSGNPNWPGGTMNSQYYDENCAYYLPANNLPASASACQNAPLSGVDAIFNNVCNGEYVIDYYSTYPDNPVVPNGPAVDGGVIPSFTRRLFTGANDLHVKLPPMMPLSEEESIYAPDYGYRIRKLNPENYAYISIGNWSAYEEARDHTLETYYRNGVFVTKIFFVGKNDGLLHYYWYDAQNQQWVHGPVGNNPGPNEQVSGDVAVDNYTEDKVYFRGTDNRIHYYQYTSGNPAYWQHDCMSPECNSPASEDAHPSSNIVGTGDQIFYRGMNDDKMHMYYKSGTIWYHKILNPGAGSNEYVAGYLTIPMEPTQTANEIFYLKSNLQIAMYTKNGTNSSNWIFSTVSPSNPPTNEQVLAGNPITAAYVEGQLYVFYVGNDFNVQYYKDVSGTWVHGYLSKSADARASNETTLFFDDNVLYYYSGYGGQTIHRFYWDNAEWRHAFLGICNPKRPPNPAWMYEFRFTSDGNIVYIDQDHQIKMLWNKRECQQCAGDYNVSHYKPGRNSGGDNGIGSAINDADAERNLRKIISDDNNYRFAIYPNPASNKLNVSLESKTNDRITLKMVNTLGATVKVQDLGNSYTNKHELQVGDLPRGLYYVYLVEQSGKVVASQKVSLQ